jgi:large subunit ribosomal protein L30
MAKAETTAKSVKKLCVKQTGSSIGCEKSQVQSLRGLGLGKIGKMVTLDDNGCIRGLIRKVSHIVKVEEA